jgi:hypothetical protein
MKKIPIYSANHVDVPLVMFNWEKNLIIGTMLPKLDLGF